MAVAVVMDTRAELTRGLSMVRLLSMATAILLAACSLAPAPNVPRLHAALWCASSEAIGCPDQGVAGILAAWKWNDQGTYIGFDALVGSSSFGLGAFYGWPGTPAVGVGGGYGCPYSDKGFDCGDGAWLVQVSAGWGAAKEAP